MTLEEWSESSATHKLLTQNLRTNIDVLLRPDTLKSEEMEKIEALKYSMLRCNLIMVRQFEESFQAKLSRARELMAEVTRIACAEGMQEEAMAKYDELLAQAGKE